MNCCAEKVDKNQPRKWPYVCAIGIVGAIVGLVIFKISPANLLFYGIMLACPLVHVFMMKDHGSHKDTKSEKMDNG